jgi:hypothetical protein
MIKKGKIWRKKIHADCRKYGEISHAIRAIRDTMKGRGLQEK